MADIAGPELTGDRATSPGSEKCTNASVNNGPSRALFSELGALGRETFRTQGTWLSYEEYLDQVFQAPQLLLRNIGAYTRDAIRSFGSHGKRAILGQEVEFFRALESPWAIEGLAHQDALIGQEVPFYKFYKLCEQFAQAPWPDKMLVFWGQSGVGKSTLGRIIDTVLERYSEDNPEGARYRLVWTFPDELDPFRVRIFGFEKRNQSGLQGSEEDQLYTIPGSLNTNPFFALPIGKRSGSIREKVIEQLSKSANWDAAINRNYLLLGALDSTSQAIFDALMLYHRGDLEKILKEHVRCERYTISSKVGRGLAHIQAVSAMASVVHQRFSKVEVERSIAPESLRGKEHTIHHVDGGIPHAAGGHVCMEDMLLDPSGGATLKLRPFLSLAETGKLQIRAESDEGVMRQEPVELLVRGDTAIDELAKYWGRTDFGAVELRSEWIPVTSILQFRTEMQALRPVLHEMLGSKGKAAPYALETFALFVTATRLLKINFNDFSEDTPQLARALERASLGAVEKALLYDDPTPASKINILRQNGTSRKSISGNDREIMARHLDKIALQYAPHPSVTLWRPSEGMIGITYRDARNMLNRLISGLSQSEEHPKILSVLEVLDFLREAEKQDFPYYSKLELQKQGYSEHQRQTDREQEEVDEMISEYFAYEAPGEIIDDVELYAQSLIQSDIYAALGISRASDALNVLKRYVAHLNAFVSKGTMQVPQEYRDPQRRDNGNADDRLMDDFENDFTPEIAKIRSGRREGARQELFRRVTGWRDSSGPVYEALDKVFPEIFEAITKSIEGKGQKLVNEFLQGCERYLDPAMLDRDKRGDAVEKSRAEAWEKAVAKLKDKNYPDIRAIVTHALWAFRDFSYNAHA